MDEMNAKLYLSEFSYHNGDHNITLNIVGINMDKNEITIAITDEGRISVQCFDLKSNADGHLFFVYGKMLEKIAVDDFEQVDDKAS